MAKLVPFSRYWGNREQKDSFYCSSKELETGEIRGYDLEGVHFLAWDSHVNGTVPLHRFFIANGDHFYTIHNEESLNLSNNGVPYCYEGIQCYVYPPGSPPTGTVPLHRYYSTKLGDHLYTIDSRELALHDRSYCIERIECFVVPIEIKAGKISVPDEVKGGLSLSADQLGPIHGREAEQFRIITRNKGKDKGRDFEKDAWQILDAFAGKFPSVVEVRSQPRVELQPGDIVIPDFDLRVHLPHENSYYFIECQNRKRNSKDILYKVQYIRSKHWRSTFIFAYPDSAARSLLESLRNEGVMTMSLADFRKFIEKLSISAESSSIELLREISVRWDGIIGEPRQDSGVVNFDETLKAPADPFRERLTKEFTREREKTPDRGMLSSR